MWHERKKLKAADNFLVTSYYLKRTSHFRAHVKFILSQPRPFRIFQAGLLLYSIYMQLVNRKNKAFFFLLFFSRDLFIFVLYTYPPTYTKIFYARILYLGITNHRNSYLPEKVKLFFFTEISSLVYRYTKREVMKNYLLKLLSIIAYIATRAVNLF